MPDRSIKIAQFWQELKRRKVLPFFIGYVAACFAIIEFFDITSNKFTIPDTTFSFLYILAVIGLPVVIILPWFINKKGIATDDGSFTIKEIADKKENKVKHNIPVQLTDFIGRERETRLIKELIGEHRIITITGSGGCGKTRLVCEAAKEFINDFRDGIWFVDLSPIAVEDLVAKEIIEVLKISEEPGRLIIDTLMDKIKDKNLLILLDNCEHLIRACSEVTGKLIQSVPGLQILATSREPLNIYGEKVWRIPSLSLLDPKSIITVENAKKSEAILLFNNRAQLNYPDFELVSENVQEVVSICNRLDGIPLAIELVASRTRHMNPRVMLERLADRFELLSSSDIQTSERQKTLHATIEWGYNLLSDNEKLLFIRLPVFRGEFNLGAVEQVCADELLPKELILDLLSSLVDRSMIHIVNKADQSMSYNVYETLRQFALQQLQAQDMEDFMRERHMQYFLKIAQKANKERTAFQSKWLNTLELEHDNLMAALRWSEACSPENFILLSGFLAWFWTWHTHFFTGMHFLEQAQLKGSRKTEAYARVLNGLGIISLFSGHGAKGLALLNESLDIWRELINPEEEVLVLCDLSFSYLAEGNNEYGLKCGKEALEIAHKIGDPGLINYSMTAEGQGLVALKQVDRARPLAQKIVVNSIELEQPLMLRLGYHYLGDCALMEGNPHEAEKEYGSSLEVAFKSGNNFFICIELLAVAMAVAGQSRLAKAIRLSAASREIATEKGILVPQDLKYEFWIEFINTYIVSSREKLGEELTRKYENEGKSMGLEKAVEYALDFSRD
jgi:predicted ATPase